jgi:energy-coupling factor transport system substrate-specific component
MDSGNGGEPRQAWLIPFIPVGIAVNVLGTVVNAAADSPLFLDSIGTVLAAAVLGPWLGALTGLLSNLIIGVFVIPINIPFGLINALIGLVVGALSRRRGFTDFLTPLYATLILTVLCPLTATPIAVYLFGGVTGGNIDTFAAILMESGHHVLSSAFLVRLPANFVDKLISTYLICFLIRWLPRPWWGLAAAADR